MDDALLSPEKEREGINGNAYSSFKLSKRMTQMEEENDDDDIFLSNEDKEVDTQIKMGV